MTPATANAPTATRPGVFFHGLLHDLTEGRQWLVVTDEGHPYRVTMWEGTDGLRYGRCNCRAATFNHLCKHVRRAAKCDALIFRAQVERSERRRVNAAMFDYFNG